MDAKELTFLKELYDIMSKYEIHRIYRIKLKDGEIVEAHQPLKTNIGKSKVSFNIYKFIKKYIPILYFKVFYKIHLTKYKRSLKQLFTKYNLDTITATEFCVYYGVYLTNNQLCLNGVDIITTDNNTYHADKLYLDINNA